MIELIPRILTTGVVAAGSMWAFLYVASEMANRWTTPEAITSFADPARLQHVLTACMWFGVFAGFLMVAAPAIAWFATKTRNPHQ